MDTAVSMQGDFSKLLAKRNSRFILDLSNCNLLQIIDAYQKHKRKTSPNFTLRSVSSILKDIQNSCLQILQPEDITDEFYSCFVEYGVKRGLKLSTIKTYCTSIRAVLSWGAKHGCTVSESYDELTVKAAEPFRVALTADDISHIAHFDCSRIPRRSDFRKTMEKVRDTFVIQTNLFCRFSDMSKISSDNFDGTIFSCVQQKTGGKAIVDIMKYSVTPKLCMSILKKYDYTCPYKGDINNYNKYLHELLSYVGGTFDEEVAFEEKVEGKVIKRVFKKRELISSHCSRRTAITLAVKIAKTETEVRRCSGHVTSGRDSFRKYIVYE